jgi:2-polyprenyl-3-methyl-5-hydroxy-6-metoxy-1,4-benzoquinol methylase
MKISQAHEPWERPWPDDGLESVNRCPICDETNRRLLYANLVDNVFRTAPGKWELWECNDCKCAYLDPRPTPASIGQAYKTYYTHAGAKKQDDYESLSGFRLLRRKLANGYLNKRYGTRYLPGWSAGAVLARMLPDQSEMLDLQFRWLPRPGIGERLLDVGCGNGDFLEKAKDAGWDGVGVDPDPNAVITAQGRGLDVREGLVDVINEESGDFDVVTLSQVIEHVHDPEELLSAVFRQLKSNGMLYIDTPNIQSLGAKLFGANWRGIESPRHLILFSNTGLRLLLKKCGFINIKIRSRRYATKGMFQSSYKLEQEASSFRYKTMLLSKRWALNCYIRFLPASRLDFITLTARKNNDGQTKS